MNTPHHFQAMQSGQAQIRHQHFRFTLAYQANGFEAVAGFSTYLPIRLLRQQALQLLPNRRMIFGKNNSNHGLQLLSLSLDRTPGAGPHPISDNRKTSIHKSHAEGLPNAPAGGVA